MIVYILNFNVQMKGKVKFMSTNKWNNRNGGITLIALVITIIVLLILAGVSITTLIGENGVINKASDAKIETEIADIKEQIQIDIIGEQVGNKENISDSVLKEILEKYGTINYDEEDGTIKSITTNKGNYEIAMADIWNGTTVADSTNTGVNVANLFDPTGNVEGKLHIGDFINYSAGIWTSTDMTTIANTGVEPNNSTDIPSTSYTFGGFAVGGSRDGNATPCETEYNYVKFKDGNDITGWRLFDVSDDGVMTLISAGCPEDYYHATETNSAYISEYILTGKENSSAIGLGTTYKARSWQMYVNEADYGATSATVLTKAKLDAWYSKYITPGADTWTDDDTFRKIYRTSTDCVNNGMYESLIDNDSFYWLSSANSTNSDRMYCVFPSNRQVGSYLESTAYGVRVLVSLSPEVKLSKEATDTKTVVSRSKEYPYNVWDLVNE